MNIDNQDVPADVPTEVYQEQSIVEAEFGEQIELHDAAELSDPIDAADHAALSAEADRLEAVHASLEARLNGQPDPSAS